MFLEVYYSLVHGIKSSCIVHDYLLLYYNYIHKLMNKIVVYNYNIMVGEGEEEPVYNISLLI